MSKLGKILLYVALAGAIAAIIGAYGAWVKLSGDKVTIAQSQQERDAAKLAADKAKKEADAANEDKEHAETELTESKNQLNDLNEKLAATQKTEDDLNAQIKDAKDATAKAQLDLQHVKDIFDGMTPEQARDAMKKAQDDLLANQSEEKILQDQLQATVVQVADLKNALNRRLTADIPPGVSGKVTFVNRTWNFVVLNVGLSNKVVPNGELWVYRGNDMLGKVKVTSVEASSSVADILPDVKGDIQVGDNVVN